MLTTTNKLTFEEFLAQYPDGYGIFELVNGEIVQVEATRALDTHRPKGAAILKTMSALISLLLGFPG